MDELASPVLIVGHGLIGAAVREGLAAAGFAAVSVGHRPRELPGYLALDLASESGRAGLARALDDLRPRCVVLVHGPSDVTWIDEHETAAAAVHCAVAAIVARSGVPAILISTDNVFPGARGGYRPQDEAEPANGYGRVKAQAERILLAGGSALVLRVSLVYGWAAPGLRSTFAEHCLAAAAQGSPLLAPTDQSFTPIHVRDVAEVTAAACQCVVPVTGIEHLAGPTELSRYEFAALAYRLAGVDTALVRPCLRQDTDWACRPRFSSLSCGNFTQLPGLAAWRPMTPEEGLRDMLANRSVAAVQSR
ncbi:MAG TPA: sugar nucleotide-binding protein [Streptosporangiaceae bacterium]|jgi:dTDP-4-dehydrorhamnose reductase